MAEIGFIILRHVNSEKTNNYWIACINSIRVFYPENKILIIDDNSNYDFITNENLYKTTIINSKYHQRGELLPYFYYLHNKLFDIAVILHDSIIINQYIDFNVNTYRPLWNFSPNATHDIYDETLMINSFNNKNLTNFYKSKTWFGCYGGMSVIRHSYLCDVNYLYPIKNLLSLVLNRHNRQSFERVSGCLMDPQGKSESILGDIMVYCRWGLSFEERNNYKHLPIYKHWSGR